MARRKPLIGENFGAELAMEQMPHGVFWLDGLGRVARANAAARQVFAGVDLAGRDLTACLESAVRHGLLLPFNPDHVARCLGGDEALALETQDGRSLSCSLTGLSDGTALVILDDVTRHQNAARLAVRDPLTGLANRREFHLRLEETLSQCARTATVAAVICIDLDHFKSINDTLGHPVGDGLLKAVAQRITSAVRSNDIVARLGGDEFAIIQCGAEQPQAAEALASRLVDLLGRTYVVQGHMLHIGASLGVALAPSDGADPDELIRSADLALYRAKAEGRGAFRFFEPEMNARMQARRSLEIDLRRAMALRQFELAYQPQVSTRTSQVVGFEALIRWRHPDRGPVSPADFIPLAEEIGLIAQIGEWVLRTACQTAVSWAKPVSIAVNLSPVQFRGGKLASLVASTLAATGLDPSRLELEITEGALIDDTDAVLATLRQLRALGVRISMDDFGTGYSSLTYLQKFPFTKIKIDQSFVQKMVADPECAAIVRAVVALGASLGMKTTAEGVETEQQLDMIRQEGCTEVQGYFTGRPLAQDAAAALLTSPTSAEKI